MPRTSSKSRNIAEDRPEERAIKVESANWWETVKHILAARETRMVAGVLLLTFAVIAVLAYVSFLFTGTEDQDILSLEHVGHEDRDRIRNIIGLPGALLAQFMIQNSFGFTSVLLVLMLAVYALRMMHVIKELRAVKLLCSTTFWVLWGAVMLGFAQQAVNLGVLRWGGMFGQWAASEMTNYVNVAGTLLIMSALLVVFLIVTDPKFIDRCKAFGLWCKNIFRRKPEPQPDMPAVVDIPLETENGTGTDTDTPVVSLITDTPENPDNTDEVTFTIEPLTNTDNVPGTDTPDI